VIEYVLSTSYYDCWKLGCGLKIIVLSVTKAVVGHNEREDVASNQSSSY
jgi:hypothetical protein